jgi:hypothetical protein
MEKVLAIVVLIIFVWLAIPRLVQGQWIAPTALMPGSWAATDTYPGTTYQSADFAQALATPPQGFGWFHFDFWNGPSSGGEPATTQDLRLRPVSAEFQR